MRPIADSRAGDVRACAFQARSAKGEVGQRMTLHQHIQKHWKTAAILVVAGILAYSVSYFW
ncbi:hypothetical protein [Microvirga sesbaniae]|uniref:hypothetical protein n=1 Tax=Microvirga sesbaniae TaxID=681392 RepID=UPI0021C7130A|nr:hypothetical protein [Microvirga sp. HBU67692]